MDYRERGDVGNFAAREGRAEVVEALIRHGADVHWMDESGRAPLKGARSEQRSVLEFHRRAGVSGWRSRTAECTRILRMLEAGGARE